MLPFPVPTPTFNLLNRLISRFIWCPRIHYKTLQLPKDAGGLALPNLKYYFWAAHLRPLFTWVTDDESTRWLKMEKYASDQAPLTALPFSDHEFNKNSVGVWTRFTIQIWSKVQKEFRLPSSTSSLKFVPQLFQSGQLKSFEQVKEEFCLSRADFHKYLQLRSFLQKCGLGENSESFNIGIFFYWYPYQ